MVAGQALPGGLPRGRGAGRSVPDGPRYLASNGVAATRQPAATQSRPAAAAHLNAGLDDGLLRHGAVLVLVHLLSDGVGQGRAPGGLIACDGAALDLEQLDVLGAGGGVLTGSGKAADREQGDNGEEAGHRAVGVGGGTVGVCGRVPEGRRGGRGRLGCLREEAMGEMVEGQA